MGLEDKLKLVKPSKGLENKVSDSYPNPNPSEIDKRFNLDKKTSFLGAVKDVVAYAPIVAAQLAIAPTAAVSTGITAAGFALGGYFQAKKQKVKYTWNRFWREIKSGNIFGYLDRAILSAPVYFSQYIDYFKGSGLLNKLALTGFFEATVIPPAVAAYNGLEYVRDEIGYGKFIGRIATLRWKSTFSEIYQKGIKGKTWTGAKNLYKIAPVLHHIQLNYMPSVEAGMAQSAFVNNPTFRYILGRKARKQEPKQAKIYKMPEYKPSKKYKIAA